MDEMKKRKLEGGLNLPCLASMADALLLSQFIRLIRSGDRKTLEHAHYWLGDILEMLVPDIVPVQRRAAETPNYFDYIENLVMEMMVRETLTVETIKNITNKVVYRELTSSFPPPKVKMESDRDYGVAWRRLHSNVVDIKARDIMFLLLHNKLPVMERLFRIRLKPDPYCLRCPQAEINDVVHFFCKCEAVSNTWSWLKSQVVRMGRMGPNVSDWDIVNLFFPNSSRGQEILWLVSSYILYVWETVHIKKQEVKLEKFFGFLTFKFKMHQATSVGLDRVLFQLLNLHYT